MKNIIDIHCHVLPGVDDGAQSIEEAKKTLQQMSSQGINAAILTPHYRRGMFETKQEVFVERFKELYPIAKELGVVVLPGCEYHVNHHLIDDITQKKRWTLAGSDHVLTEYSGASDYDYIRKYSYELISHGYTPVIAHVERIRCLVGDIDAIEELCDLGVKIQVNADAVLGIEGGSAKRFCKKLLKADFVDYIASDCHGMKYRPSHLAECADYIERKYGQEIAKRIFVQNPRELISSRR